MKDNYVVYTHTSPSGKVYVGQSINYKRRWGTNGEHYKTKKKNGEYIQPVFAHAILKYGWDAFTHEIVLDHQLKSEADYAEKYLISWYKSCGLSYNITDGGEGTCGAHPALSEERKRQISEFMQINHPRKGKHHTEETKRKLSAASKGRVLSEERRKQMSEISKGRKHTEESKNKMSEYKKMHPETWIGGWNKKVVYQYDLNGNYITSYPSATSAADSVGRNISGDIGKCVEGKTASAGGYLWRKEKLDHIDMSNYRVVITPKGARLIGLSEEERLKRSAAHGKAINQYSLSGEYLASYCTASEAHRQTGANLSGIQRCCKHDYKYKTAGGYRWEYDTIDNRKNL